MTRCAHVTLLSIHYKTKLIKMKVLQCLVALTGLFIFIAQAASTNSYILTIDQENGVISSTFLEDVKSLVFNLGGKITHEYSLIKGFTMDVSDDVLPHLKEQLQEAESRFGYKVYLEKDSDVHAFAKHEEN